MGFVFLSSLCERVIGVKVFLLGCYELLCFCLSGNCFIIVSFVMRNYWDVIISVFVFLCVLIFLFSSGILSGVLFNCLLCVLLSSGLVVFLSIISTVCFKCYYRGKHVIWGMFTLHYTVLVG